MPRRPQVQERLTTQVADAIYSILEPRGVIVVIECEHLCMTMRGVRKPGSKTITSAVRGQLRDRCHPRRGHGPDHQLNQVLPTVLLTKPVSYHMNRRLKPCCFVTGF